LDTPYQFQYLPNVAPEDAQIVFLPIAYDDTVCGRRGTADGPRAIFEASGDLEYYDEDFDWSPFLHLSASVAPELRRADGEAESAFHERITAAAQDLYSPDDARLLIALGGEHSITPSVIDGCLSSPATIIVLDAHADLRSAYQGSALSHACTMHRLRVRGHRVVIIALRSLAGFEAERLRSDDGIVTYWARDLVDPAGREEMLQALARLDGDVWLSIDMDAFDPAFVPGVGTPQPGGIDWYTAFDIQRTLFENRSAIIRGLDIVETIPDRTQVSQVTAAKLVQKAVSLWGKRHGYDKQQLTGSQTRVDYE